MQTMGAWSNVLKLIQVASVCVCTDWRGAAETLPLWQWLLCFALIGFGQHLNFMVYKLLGVDGVYYGSRFGKKLPWITAYPYNTIRDPQYVGCMITLLGCAMVAPLELCLWWLANYLYLMWHESELPSEPETPQPPALLAAEIDAKSE
jgi:protein-S-isoprenylcysteine O-methyltransferase Ste14